jgi:preflagellin peptidase FlaK
VDDASVGLRYLLGFAMLAGAVPSDLRARRVPNQWWIPFIALAAALVLGDLLDPARDGRRLAIAYGGAAAVAGAMYLFWRLRLFGGADAKALMVLAFLVPWPSPKPATVIQPALDALSNGCVLMLAVPVACLLLNALRGDAALPAMLLGWRVPLAKARAAHVWPLQQVRDGRVRWRFWQKASLDSLDAVYDGLEAAGVERVWVTAKVPFLVPLAAGLALAWRWGNLLLALAARVATA